VSERSERTSNKTISPQSGDALPPDESKSQEFQP
jgi:hypothetical protein